MNIVAGLKTLKENLTTTNNIRLPDNQLNECCAVHTTNFCPDCGLSLYVGQTFLRSKYLNYDVISHDTDDYVFIYDKALNKLYNNASLSINAINDMKISMKMDLKTSGFWSDSSFNISELEIQS